MVQVLDVPHSAAIDLAETPAFGLGPLRVDPAMRTIARGDDQRELQPRVMQVLVALAEARPNVVSREKLIARCWNGRIVGDDAINRCVQLLRAVTRGLGGGFEVQNVARVGYRLVVDAGAPETGVPGARKRFGLGHVAVAAAALILTVGVFHWASGPARDGTPPAKTREAERLYLSGSTMLRTGNPQAAGDARVLMQQAIAADPRYAPAWAGLAKAKWTEASIQGPERVITVLPEARGLLHRALALSPDLAVAHGYLGELSGFTSPEAQRHLRRAAKLAPDSAESRLWLATARRASGDFAGEIAEYRKARQLDHNWYRPQRDLGIALAEMGDRQQAERIAAALPAPFPGCAGMPSRIKWIYGDMAESARCSAGTAKVPSMWGAPARVALATARLTLGLSRDGKDAGPIHLIDTRPPQGRIWMAEAPTPAEWRRLNRSADAALIYRMTIFVSAKRMLNDGRASEVLAPYDGGIGLGGIRRDTAVQAADLPWAALVARALQAVGRNSEATDLLARSLRVVDETYRRGPVPFTFDAEAASIAAASGQADRAIALLRRARDRGWVNNGWSDLLQLRDEPAFSALSGDQRFETVAADLDRLYARERQKAVSFGI